MSKKTIISKGFNNLLKSTEISNIQPEAKTSPKVEISERSDFQTLKRLNVQKHEPKILDYSGNDNSKSIEYSLNIEDSAEVQASKAKYRTFRRCTLYLPPDIFRELNIEKIKSGKDLSELAAESIKQYLEIKGYTF